MSLSVFSEIGRLRRVLIHRPGIEIDWMVPAMMERLLFDDILDGDRAREEHANFRGVIARAGVELLDAEELLAEVLERDEVRGELLAELEEEFHTSRRLIERLRALAPAQLAAGVLRGLRVPRESARAGHFFDLLPVPNYFFQRDPLLVLGDGVVVASMATDAREREPLLSELVFRHHPRLGPARMFELERPPHAAPDVGPMFEFPTLEGGDVLVASPEIVLVGISERTNRRGAEALAEHLQSLPDTSFRWLLMVELPPRRAFMHLDTVFTFVDHGLCLGYPQLIDPSGPEALHVYCVDLQAPQLVFRKMRSLLSALAELEMPVELVPCGGPVDVVDQQREQWTDGANAFALAPGVILLYERNRRTIEELARRGWRVLSHEQVLSGEPLLDRGPTVVTFLGHELSRARGGPRCMTMPLERDPL